MAKSRKSKPAAAKDEEYVSSSTTIGIAFEMPEESIAASMADEMPIDFQAKQDSISEIRRSPGTKLAPKIKRTSIKPAKAKETEVKL